MAKLVSLQMISFVSLLIFNGHMSSSSSAEAGSHKCISMEQVNITFDRFQRRYWDKMRFSRKPRDARTCAQAATEMVGDLEKRALSPWKYSLNKEDNRFPYEVPFAECLCQGCIINQREDFSYNSVPVSAVLMVMRKTRCPQDQNKYVVRKDFINVPVACTCAVPKYTK